MTTSLIDIEARNLVKQLERIGIRPPEKLVQRILAAGEPAIEPLLELATNMDAIYDAPPTCYGPIHALRLLGEIKDPSYIENLLLVYPQEEESDADGLDEPLSTMPNLWDRELPQIIGSMGAAGVDQLWEYADDSGNQYEQRSAAMTSLAYATAVAPELRESVVLGLHQRLVTTDDPIFAAYVLISLVNLQVPEYYPEVMTLYKEGRIDRKVIPPGSARQYLLQKNPKLLECAKHPLWERYDQHRLES